MNVQKVFKRLAIVALLLPVLVTGSLTLTRAAEPLIALKTDEVNDGSAAGAGPTWATSSEDPTDPLDSLSRLTESRGQSSIVDAENVELIGQTWGITFGTFVRENYAYVGQGPRLIILDISNLSSPALIGKTPPLPGLVRGIYVSGDYAYVADGDRGLSVVDVSEPSSPNPVGFCDTPGYAHQVSVSGDFAYVADEWSGLRVMDVSDPANPIEVGSYDTAGRSQAVHLSGSTAYLTVKEEGLHIMDISNPDQPVKLGSCPLPGEALDVDISDGTAYVVDRSGLQVVDVSDPSNPIAIGSYETPGDAQGLYVSGSTAYVGDGFEGLHLIDVSNPVAPGGIGSYGTPGFIGSGDVYVCDGTAFLAARSQGLRIVNMSDPADPKEVGSYEASGGTGSLWVSGGTAFVTDRGNGIRVVDIAEPTDLVEIGSYKRHRADARDVYVSGSIAYVADWGLRVVDVSDPAQPTLVGAHEPPGLTESLYVSGTTAYLTDDDAGLWLIDVSDPADPTELGVYDSPGDANDVYVSGSNAYLADGNAGLRVVDVSDRTAPTELGQYDTPHHTTGVYVSNDIAYVVDYNGQLRMIDVSNPANPVEIGHYDTPGEPQDVYVGDATAYLVDGYGGLRLLDVSDPSNPIEFGYYDTAGYAQDVFIDNRNIYVADGDGGLVVLRYTGPSAPTLDPIANSDGDSSYSVGWSAVAGATSYTLQEDETIGFTSPTLRYSGGDSEYTIDGQSAGTWYYRVKASNAIGDGDWSNVESVTVEPAPVAAFTASPTSGAFPLNVVFTDQSTGSITDWSWTFGDGTISNAPNPSHTYDAAGDYTVSLTVNGPGGSDTDTKAAYITVHEPVAAGFTGTPRDGAAPLSVDFVNNSTGDYDTCTWTFGDGDTSDSCDDLTHTYDLAGDYTISLTVSGPGGSDAHTKSDYIHVDPPPPGVDTYEFDDTCSDASVIPTDGTVQNHTFHQQGDKDWVVNDLASGTTYVIEVQVPAGSPANVVAELYDTCAGLPVESQDYAFTPGVRFQFEPTSDGLFYLKLLNHDPSQYGPDVAYQLSIRALDQEPSLGALVLVGGRLRMNDPVQDNIHYVTDAVRRFFLTQGYDDERITYLTTDGSLEGWDALPTAAKLEAAITDWAPGKVGQDRAFNLYLVDHGQYDEFYLDKPGGEWVTPQQIDEWLDQLESSAPGTKVNVIAEACHAGSFVDLAQTVSAPGRVVIASTGAHNVAWASDDGAIFSDHFLTALEEGQSLYGGFQTARWAVQSAHPDQTPWIDDDGDGVANGVVDGEEAARRGFSLAGTLAGNVWPPYVVQATGPDITPEGEGVIQAEVRDDQQVRRVWAVIYPPSYEAPASSEAMLQEDLPTVTLLDPDGDDVYTGFYKSFNEQGIYRVVIHAEDDALVEARPLAIEAGTKWSVYLPVTLRRWPPAPDTPSLAPIDNADGDGSYTVHWRPVDYAASYRLQEAKASDFGDAVMVHEGPETSRTLTGRGAARYRYRVQARNGSGASGWSNVASVDVLWEAEPNDNRLTEANGPILPGLTYYGTFPHPAEFDKDYFMFELAQPRRVTVWLTNIPAGQNYDLALWDRESWIVFSAKEGQADEVLGSDTLQPGQYFIQVYHNNSGGSKQPYHLRMGEFPP